MRASMWRKALGVLVCGTALVLAAVGTASADDKLIEEMKARLDKLEKQNEELRQKVGDGTSPVMHDSGPYKPEVAGKEAINKIVETYLKEKESQKKAEADAKKAKEEEEGYKVGSDLGLTVRWNAAQGLLFESKNKDFVSHIGYFMQWDTVAFTQNHNLLPTTQLGEYQDGTYFRRIRPLWDGRAWDFVEWNVILALEQVQGDISGGTPPAGTGASVNSNINLDEVWMGVYGLPFIGRIRAGHLKVTQGLEGNQWSSSRAQTFLENAAYTDAFYNIFGTGVQLCNSGLNDGCNGDRVSWQAMVYRNDNPRTNTGEDFGDGDYAATARATALLIDDCEDRHFLHVGLSGTWRKSQRVTNDLTGPTVTNVQARAELRDAFGGFDGGGSGVGNFPGNNNRMVATGAITNNSQGVIGTELWYNLGPFSMMAEYAVEQLNDAQITIGTGAAARRFNGTRTFTGGYITLSYFLTGESRAYDHTFGREYSFYIQRPNTNFWFSRDEDGGFSFGPGAWEIAARWSYLNLNDGPVQGGVLNGVTLGLNWYINNNLKVQFDYVHDNRYDKGAGTTGAAATAVTGAGGNVSGAVDGFGTRVQVQF